MSAPKVGQQGEKGVQKAPKAPRSGGQMAQTGARDQVDNGNERSTTSFFSYSDCPKHAFWFGVLVKSAVPLLISVLMAISWLLPNHYPPWSAFHMDAWIASILLVVAWLVLPRSSGIFVSCFPLMVAALVGVLLLQWYFDLIRLDGVAWISAAYLIGFAFAILLGQQWEQSKPGQAADGLFLAIAIAAFVSVGMQLHQWLNLDEMDIWSMGPGLGRPFANFGQPNQLSTFLLWGILAIAWAYLRGVVRPAVAMVAIAFLLWGVALTHSRTAWIAFSLLTLASWYWRGYWPNKKLPWVMFGLSLYFFACVWLIGLVNMVFDLNSTLSLGELGRMGSEIRPQAWAMFVDAVMRQPWLGYGMNQVPLAQMTVAPDHAALNQVFAQAHNLFLDFALWFGLPIGFFITGYLLRWIWQHGSSIRRAEDAVLFMVLIVVGNHAMLELPLHYAYFLLPAGLIFGLLDTRVGVPIRSAPSIRLSRPVLIVILSGLSLFFVIVVRDYLRVEESYRTLRFELANFKYAVRGTEPDVLLLTQWRDFIRMARIEPLTPLTAQELVWFRNVASTMPSAGGSYKLAGALAMQNQAPEAQLWLTRLCKMQPRQQCEAVRVNWQAKAKLHPELEKVDWAEIAQSQ